MTAFIWQAAILISIAYITGCFFGVVCRLVFTGTGEIALTSISSGSKPQVTVPVTIDAANSNDDLKRIRGVGPQLEKRLKNSGITSFDQIAGWRAAEVQKFAEELRLGQKIEQQDWVGQARGLIAGSG